MLLSRAAIGAEEAIGRLVGMQAQAPKAPFTGLWSRLEGFRPGELDELLEGRRVARAPLMRVTVHLVTVADCLHLRALTQPMIERTYAGSSWAKAVAGLDLDEVLAAARELVEEEPRERAELGRLLAKRWPDRDPLSLAYAFTYLAPAVQVPPRGLWERSGQATWTTMESWLGHALERDPEPDAVVLRYLAAYGPASVRDVQTWCGLTRLRAVLDRLRPRLRTFRDESGAELFDLPDAPRPDPDTPAPPRFLPEFDNALLSHHDRTRVIADKHRELIFTKGALLVDGFAVAAWQVRREKGAAILRIEPFGGQELPREHRGAIDEEAARLIAFHAGDGERVDVQVL